MLNQRFIICESAATILAFRAASISAIQDGPWHLWIININLGIINIISWTQGWNWAPAVHGRGCTHAALTAGICLHTNRKGGTGLPHRCAAFPGFWGVAWKALASQPQGLTAPGKPYEKLPRPKSRKSFGTRQLPFGFPPRGLLQPQRQQQAPAQAKPPS
jgi:hypothetical protein